MIDFTPIFSLFEQLEKLVRERDKVTDARFKLAVEDIYKEMQAIHQDYLRMFERAASAVEVKTFVEVRDQLASERVGLEARREALRQLVDRLGPDRRFLEYRTFLERVAGYLFRQNSSFSRSVLEAVEKILADKPPVYQPPPRRPPLPEHPYAKKPPTLQELDFDTPETLKERFEHFQARDRMWITTEIQSLLAEIRARWKAVSVAYADAVSRHID
jgi:hypothetical protein